MDNLLRKKTIEICGSETIRKFSRVCFVVLSLSIINYQLSIAKAQQRTVIAGLENNTEYRALIEEESAMVRTADSLTAGITSLRSRLRIDTVGRAAASAAIVSMEERVFEIRSGMARLASRINTIEQEWILAGLLSPSATVSDTEGEEAENSVSNLVYNPWFESGLSSGQLAELRGAQEAESRLPDMVAQYRTEHEELRLLAMEYDMAAAPAAVDSIKGVFDSLKVGLVSLDGTIGSGWEAVFDSKGYLYNLLADKENKHELLTLFEAGMERLREEKARWLDQGAPAALLDYVLQKRMLTDYEIALASAIGNEAAADSLRGVLAALPGPASLDGLAPVELKEKLLLDYSDITIGDSPYNASNPIPEVAVWPKGVIWRVQVGNFASRQSPSVFRGAHPLSVGEGGDGRFRYYAGGFPTDSLAGAAVEQLRKAGFRSPSPVVWMDGEAIDPAAESEKIYRINIFGIEELDPAVREVIASATGGEVDIVVGEGGFMLGPLDGPAAVRLRSALETLKASTPEMEVQLQKIPV